MTTSPLHTQGAFTLDTFPEAAAREFIGWDPPKSWLYHLCPGSHSSEKGWAVNCNLGECGHCKTPVPDEIWGLWKLHNFEYIQATDCSKGSRQ